MFRPALGSPYRGLVITGKPGIRLALSCFGFAQSLFPALCRQDTSCAWRSRLRRTCPTGGQDVAAGVAKSRPEGILGRRWPPKRCSVGSIPESLSCLGGSVCQGTPQVAKPGRTETCEKRYAQCHFAHREVMLSIMFQTFNQVMVKDDEATLNNVNIKIMKIHWKNV